MTLLILLLAPLLSAEPMLYMFPTNPQLHPPAMYPNQQFMRGKVRDLPDSGVIYLNRIKPIGQEFKQKEQQGSVVEVSVKNLPRGRTPSSFEKYNSEEERAPTRRPTTTTTTTTTTVAPRTHAPPRFFAETKIDDQKLPFQKSSKQLSVPEEAELDRLLDDLLKNDNVPKQTLQLAKLKRNSSKRHVGAIPPKLISFDGTARVDTKPRARAHASPVSVRLQQKKSYVGGTSSTRNHGPDFDPWERMGQ